MVNKINGENDKKKVFFIAVTDEPDSKNRAYSDFVLNLCLSSISSSDLETKVDINSFIAHYQICSGNIKQSIFNSLVLYDCFVALIDDVDGSYNPNVWFELGVVSTMNCPLVLIASENTVIPFDSNDISIVRISSDLKEYWNDVCESHNMNRINWNTEVQKLSISTSNINRQHKESYSDFSIDFTNHLGITLKDGNPFNSLYDNAKIKSLGFNGLYDMLVNTRMINLLESNGVTAEYISGEEEAFKELAREVKKAKCSLRTTRFADQSIVATEPKPFYNEFMEALYFASKNVDKCYRIICNNNHLKWHDIYDVLRYSGPKMKVFVRKQKYSINFELVIIDEVVAFIHFYQTNRSGDKDNESPDRRHDSSVQQIKSTLKITGSHVCKELARIFDRLHHRDIDANEPSDLSRTLLGVENLLTLSEEEKSRGYFSLENYTFTDNAVGIRRKESRIKEMFNHALKKWEITGSDLKIMRNGIASVNGEDVNLGESNDGNE